MIYLQNKNNVTLIQEYDPKLYLFECNLYPRPNLVSDGVCVSSPSMLVLKCGYLLSTLTCLSQLNSCRQYEVTFRR